MSDSYEDIFDILINLNDPYLFNSDLREELAEKIVKYEKTKRTMVSTLLSQLEKMNCTLGDLVDAFTAVQRNYPDNQKYNQAMNALIGGIKDMMKDPERRQKMKHTNSLQKIVC